MKGMSRSLGMLVVAIAAIALGFFGFDAFQDARFARAQNQVESTRQQLAQVEDLASVFRNVGKVVEPSVVNINVKRRVSRNIQGSSPFDEEMLRRFFPDLGEGEVPEGLIPDDGRVQVGTGSGVIVEVSDGKGFIVTNNHVVGGATELLITLHDGRRIDNAKVIGTDPKTDLAVVQIEADRLIPAKWGNSDEMQKGDWVMAFGSPFGYVGSMTHGIISATNRHNVGILGTGGYEDFIQVDAAINPGNSGGPLTNIRGEVIGINTAIASRTGGFQGIGFAIPSNMARTIYRALRENGTVVRGWLGVGIEDISEAEEAARGGYTGERGVLVRQVFPSTPASGLLRPGDVIIALNGKPVENVQRLRNAVADTAPGTEITLQVYRAGKTEDVTITVGQQPDNIVASLRGEQPAPSTGGQTTLAALGIRLSDWSEELAKRFSLPEGRQGAIVTSVNQRSLAARAGLRTGDLITHVDGQEVTSARQATELLNKADLKKGVALLVVNREAESQIILRRED